MFKQMLAFAMSVTMLASTCMTAAAEVIAPQSYYKNSVVKTCNDSSMHSHSDIDYHNHDESCVEAVKVAVFDTGITNPNIEIAGSVSFVEDSEITNDHGNNMAEVLTSYVESAEIYDVRVLDNNGEGYYSDVAKAVDWSIANDIDVITMSFVGKENSTILEDAIEKAEENSIIVIAAAGNDAEEKATFPSAYDSVVSVGALDSDYNFAEYSNFGKFVDTYAYEPMFEGTSASVQQVAGSVVSSLQSDVSKDDVKASFESSSKAKVENATASVDGKVYAALCSSSHSYSSFYTTYTAATCKSTGLKYRFCTTCGYRIYYETPKLAHTVSSTYKTLTYATCVSTGTKAKYCTVCNATISTEVIPKSTQHDLERYPKTIYPTCKTEGYTYYPCKNCNVVKKISIINKLPHTESSGYKTLSPATCTSSGTEAKYCTKCNATISTRRIDIKPHTESSTYKTLSAATCTSSGTEAKYCTKCNATISTRQIAAKGHNYHFVSHLTPVATCTKDGLGLYQCSRCATTKKDTTKATGHSFGPFKITKNPTTDNEGEKTRECTKVGCYAKETQTLAKLDIITNIENITNYAGATSYDRDTNTVKICSNGQNYDIATYDNGRVGFHVKSNHEWKVSSTQDWLKFKVVKKGSDPDNVTSVTGKTITDKNNEYEIIIYADYNKTSIERTGRIILTYAGYTKELKISQSGASVLSSHRELTTSLIEVIEKSDWYHKYYFAGTLETNGIVTGSANTAAGIIHYAVYSKYYPDINGNTGGVIRSSYVFYEMDQHNNDAAITLKAVDNMYIKGNNYPLMTISVNGENKETIEYNRDVGTSICTTDPVTQKRYTEIKTVEKVAEWFFSLGSEVHKYAKIPTIVADGIVKFGAKKCKDVVAYSDSKNTFYYFGDTNELWFYLPEKSQLRTVKANDNDGENDRFGIEFTCSENSTPKISYNFTIATLDDSVSKDMTHNF